MQENNMSEFSETFRDVDGDEMIVTVDTFGTVCELCIFHDAGCLPMDANETERLGKWLLEKAAYMKAETEE